MLGFWVVPWRHMEGLELVAPAAICIPTRSGEVWSREGIGAGAVGVSSWQVLLA